MRARKGSNAPLTLWFPLTFHRGSSHEADGESYTAEAQHLLRDMGELLPDARSGWYDNRVINLWAVPQVLCRGLRENQRMNAGVCFLILAMLLTPAVDGVAKTLSAEHTPMMIAFVRYFSAGLIALLVARGTGRRIVVAEGDRVGQLAAHRADHGRDDRAHRRPRHGARWPRPSAAS